MIWFELDQRMEYSDKTVLIGEMENEGKNGR